MASQNFFVSDYTSYGHRYRVYDKPNNKEISILLTRLRHYLEIFAKVTSSIFLLLKDCY